jgi:GAF domain-containing protein
MFTALSSFFVSPEDKDPSFIRLVRNILIFTLVATIASAIINIATLPAADLAVTLAVLAGAALVEMIALGYTLRGKVTMAKAIIPAAMLITITVVALSADSIHDISIIAFPLILIAATLLQGKRAVIATTPLAVIALLILGILDMLGLSKSPFAAQTGVDELLIGVLLLLTGSAFLHLLTSRLHAVIQKAQQNELAQVNANQELKDFQASLEERVHERTSELTQRSMELEQISNLAHRRAAQFEAVTQVTQDITSIRDLQDLLPRIASVISKTFGFYHVGVFLLDEVNEYAVLTATNSDGGNKMLARHHRLRVGEQGIVGNVTSTGKPRIAMDVGADAVFFDNPELPDTHSEMALPLLSSNRVIGALDVQSTDTGAFGEEDIRMLSVLANQVSLAIENARLFEETRRALAESEAVSRQIIREAWKKLPTEQKLLGYRYSLTGAAPLHKPLVSLDVRKGKVKSTPTEAARVVIPIELRGETIGSLVVQSPDSTALNQDQIDLIKAVAERVAISAENARLFDETTRRAERERTVSDITGKIRSVNDPQTMIQIAIEELRNALGASRVEIVPQTIQGSQ